MKVLSLILGVLCLAEVFTDAFQTIVLPRRATGKVRVSRLFLIATWLPWKGIAQRMRNGRPRESFLSYYGPLTLLMLIVVWAAVLIVGFALIYYGLGTPFSDPHPFGKFETCLYVSGTTMFTLGLGDVLPLTIPARLLFTIQAGTGLGFVACIIGYLPVLYGAFSRREVSIILLDARAGSPPTAVELLRRHAGPDGATSLQMLLIEWERWSAELLESHISYPLLCFFRSQHDNQSWLSALIAILDTCALLITTLEGESARQAQLTFAMARHAVLDLEHNFPQYGIYPYSDRLPPDRVEHVCNQLSEAGYTLCASPSSLERLRELRAMYEPAAWRLSGMLMQPLQPFYPEPGKQSSWLIIAQMRSETEASLAQGRRAVLNVTPTVTNDSHRF